MRRKQLASWILYDFANTIFSMCVVSLYFSTWITKDLDKEDIWYSIGTSVSMLLVVWTMPFLGDFADRSNKKGRLLHLMTLVCVGFTCLMSASSRISGSTISTALVGVIFFIIANYAYQGALVFYNAFLPEIAAPDQRGKISGWGVSIGYLGAIVGIALVSPFYDGTIFGWNVPWMTGWGREAAFLPAGLLFLIFAAPVFFYLKDSPAKRSTVSAEAVMRPSILAFPLIKYIKIARELKLLRFLSAKFFYEECIETIIIVMTIYLIQVFGFSQSEAGVFFLAVIPAAVIGAALCGYLVDRLGPKNTLLGVLAGWILTLVFIIIATDKSQMWIVGCLAGIFLGSTWASARPLLIMMSPPDRIAECFGLYAISGKAAAIVGPLVWGLVLLSLSSYSNVVKYKAAVGSLLLFMVIGFIILLGVMPPKNEKPKQV